MYNPKADIFTVLQKFDRPMTLPQLCNALPAIPQGTISSTLNLFTKEKLVEMAAGKGRAHTFRLVVQKLPGKYEEGRLKEQPKKGVTRNRGGKIPDAVLLMIPLPKGASAVVTVKEAKRIYEALAPFFKVQQ